MGNSASTARIPVSFTPKAKPQRLRATDTVNLLVLIGGTTQPVNLGAAKDPTADPRGQRSQGHSDDGVTSGNEDYWGMTPDKLLKANLTDLDWYWQDDFEFRKALVALSEEYLSFKIFAAHGWSGDNAIANRQVAGAYLANRLCGGEGETPYYEKSWRNKPMHIHLMGHSHGGNVVNEFLQQAAKLGSAWPARWRVRSVTYLSTPFFQRLHPLNTASFDPECRIINVTDDYDLTQRVIADFSMLPLRNVLLHAGADELLSHINKLSWEQEVVDEAIASINVDASFEDWDLKVEIVMAPENGDKLYDQGIGLLNQLELVVREASSVVQQLKIPLKYPSAPGLQGKIRTERPILSEDSAKSIEAALRLVWDAVQPLREQLQTRRTSSHYPVKDILAEFLDSGSPLVRLLDTLGALIAIDPQTLEGPLSNMLVAVALDQVEDFDDTVRSPAAQLAGTPFAQHLEQVDVSMRNEYRKRDDLRAHWSLFPAFIAKLEASEKAYAERRQQRDVVDLMLRLVAQVSKVRGLVSQYRARASLIGGIKKTLGALAAVGRVASWFDGGRTTIYEALDRVATSADTWMALLAERDAGPMEVPSTPANPIKPPLGSLDHFMYVSHSVSRRQLHPEVEAILREQITSLKHQLPKAR